MRSHSLKQRIKIQLIRRADNVRQNMAFVMIGMAVLMLGFILLAITEHLLKNSLHQELLAILALILAIGGTILAIFGYISLSILWIFRFIYSDNNTK